MKSALHLSSTGGFSTNQQAETPRILKGLLQELAAERQQALSDQTRLEPHGCPCTAASMLGSKRGCQPDVACLWYNTAAGVINPQPSALQNGSARVSTGLPRLPGFCSASALRAISHRAASRSLPCKSSRWLFRKDQGSQQIHQVCSKAQQHLS